jgi:hypothetical protein
MSIEDAVVVRVNPFDVPRDKWKGVEDAAVGEDVDAGVRYILDGGMLTTRIPPSTFANLANYRAGRRESLVFYFVDTFCDTWTES